MKLYNNIHILIIILSICSCSKSKQVDSYKKEYEVLENIKKEVSNLLPTKSDEYIYHFLDSLENNVANRNTSLLLSLKKLYWIEDTSSLVADKLFELKNVANFESFSPLLKHKICIYLSNYYKDQGNNHYALDLLFEAVGYIEPFEEIFNKEIGNTYLNISAYSSLFFNEHQSGEKTISKGLEIAIKYNHIALATDFICNSNLKRMSNGAYKETIENAYKSIALCKGNTAFSEQITISYILIRSAHLKLGQLDSIKVIDKTIKSLLEKKILTEDNYAYYLLCTIDTELQESKTDNIHHFEYLESHFLSKPSQNIHHLLILYKNMANYSLIVGDIDLQIKYSALIDEYLKKMSPVFDELLKDMRKVYVAISTSLKNEKSYKQLINIHEKINKIDTTRHSILTKKTDAYQKQVQFWADKDIKIANQQMEIQKNRARFWTILFGIGAIFGLVLIYLMRKLRIANKKVSEQKIELETVVNSIPIGLCKIDHNFKMLWSNKVIKTLYKLDKMPKVGMNYKELLHPTMFEIIENKINLIGKKEVIVIEKAINERLEVMEEFEEGMTWLKGIYIPVKNKKGKIESFIVLNDDHTKEKLDKHNLELQKNKIEENKNELASELKQQLLLLSNQNNMIEKLENHIQSNMELSYKSKKQISGIIDLQRNNEIIENINIRVLELELKKEKSIFYL